MADTTRRRAATPTAAAPTAPNTAIVNTDGPKNRSLAFAGLLAEKVSGNLSKASGDSLHWTAYQTRLAINLGVKIEMRLSEMETRRLASNQKKDQDALPITTANIDMTALITRVKDIVALDLDASLPNHVNIIPYFNNKSQLYDINIRPGYEGSHHSKTKLCINPPKKSVYKLVFATDFFDIEENAAGGEKPIHKPTSFFQDRGEVVGGYAWYQFEDPALDYVVIVDEYEFEKARKAAGGPDFWGGDFQETKWVDGDNGRRVPVKVGEPVYDQKFEREMQYKTVVWRGTKTLKYDPMKVNIDAVLTMEASEVAEIGGEVAEEIQQLAGSQTLAIEPPITPVAEMPTAGQPAGEPASVEPARQSLLDDFASAEEEF